MIARQTRVLLLAVSVPAIISATTAPSAPITRPVGPSAPTAPFAAQLAESGAVLGPSLWAGADRRAAFARATARPASQRQMLRWEQVRAAVGEGDYAGALAIAEVMAAADPDLMLSAPFRLATGVALTGLGRSADALSAFSHPLLVRNAEACAWRMRAHMGAGDSAAALAETGCAIAAINARPAAQRGPFLRSAARAALDERRVAQAMRWLGLLGDGDAEANLLRGRALLASSKSNEARFRLNRAIAAGSPPIAAEARLARITMMDDGLARRKALDALLFAWRGDETERRALALAYRLAAGAGDLHRQMALGAVMLRHGQAGADSADVPQAMRAILARAADPDGGIALSTASDLIWDYRDFLPAGGRGAALAWSLSRRLEKAGLFARAAELTEHGMADFADDAAAGIAAIRAANLWLLAEEPARAIAALRVGDSHISDAMRHDRARVEAVALARLGRPAAALALLEDVPGSVSLRQEISWQAGLWADYRSARKAERARPASEQAALRDAIAMSMVGDEAGLAALRRSPIVRSSGLLQALSAPAGSMDMAAVRAALAKMEAQRTDEPIDRAANDPLLVVAARPLPVQTKAPAAKP